MARKRWRAGVHRRGLIPLPLLLAVLLLVAVFSGGVVVGAIVQHLRAGYWHKVLASESFPFPDGEVRLIYKQESIGMPFIEPETSVLTVEIGHHLPITVYKAKRMFQESTPLVRDVRTDGNRITWQDGINTYTLIVNPVEEEAGHTPAADGLRSAPAEWSEQGDLKGTGNERAM